MPVLASTSGLRCSYLVITIVSKSTHIGQVIDLSLEIKWFRDV